MARINWKATERCTTAPSPSSHRSFANVKFRLDPNDPLTDDETRYLDGPGDWEGLAPEIFVDVDRGELATDTGLSADGISIAVIVRDRDLGRFESVAEWPLNDVPDDAWSLAPMLERFSRSLRLDVAVVATPRQSDEPDAAPPIMKGTLLATKTFRIRSRNPLPDFPTRIVEPDEMARQKGLDRATVCYVRWCGDDLHRPPSELIEVWLNKDCEDKFRALSSRVATVAADHIGRSIGVQVWADVLARVLGETDEEPDEPGSLLGVVSSSVERELGMTLDEVRSIYEPPDGKSRLLPWAWKLAAADRTFGALKL